MMGDIVNINDTTDVQLLERFKRLEDIIPECMKGVLVNPFIQHIRDNGEVSISLVEFLNHSEFLELLTPGLLLISKELFDKKADTEWYKIMLSIIEEKDDIEAFCENLPLCVEMNIDCEIVRDMVEKSNSVSDMTTALAMYAREHRKDKAEQKTETNSGGGLPNEYYIDLCRQQENFISQLMAQIEELKHKEKELSHGLEEATFHSEFASINVEERCKELEMKCEELEKQRAELQAMYDKCDTEKTSVIQKSDEEKKALSDQIEQLENNVECLKMDMESIEKQLQNALKNRQALHKSYIEEKRTSMRYKVKADKLESQITDISETKAKCESLERTVLSLEEEKAQLDGKVEEALANAEQLRLSNNQQESTIRELNDTLIEKDNEIARLMAQIKDFEERLSNSSVGVNPSVVAAPTWSQQALVGNDTLLQEAIMEEEVEEAKEFPDSQMISFESGVQSVKRKSNWFTNLIAQHSKKAFLKNDRQDQESMIFIKMMEMRYSTEKMQKVRSSLSENIPCFDLYKLICGDPSIEELDAFFSKYSQSDAAFA